MHKSRQINDVQPDVNLFHLERDSLHRAYKKLAYPHCNVPLRGRRENERI